MTKDEKLLFLEAVKRLRLLDSIDAEIDCIFDIYKKFIDPSAPHEINIDAKIRTNIINQLDEVYMASPEMLLNMEREGRKLKKIYDDAHTQVLADMVHYLEVCGLERSTSLLDVFPPTVGKRASRRSHSLAGDLFSSVSVVFDNLSTDDIFSINLRRPKE